MSPGEKFQYPPAGNTRGSVKEIFVQLSPNHKNLHWGDYDNKVEEWRKSEDQSRYGRYLTFCSWLSHQEF